MIIRRTYLKILGHTNISRNIYSKVPFKLKEFEQSFCSFYTYNTKLYLTLNCEDQNSTTLKSIWDTRNTQP